MYRVKDDVVVKSGIKIEAPDQRPAARPKLRWQDTLYRDMEAVGLQPGMAQTRTIWKTRTTTSDPAPGKR